MKVILGEEVKTASQGEVIGLFIQEKIPRGLTLQETIAEIKRQGGVVYVPHPFDRMHAVPDYEHLLDVLDDIDAIEVFNPRVAVGTFNDEARRFATKYRLAQGAGSDAHVAQGLGSVRIRMPDFDGPEEFLAGLRMAEIAPRPAACSTCRRSSSWRRRPRRRGRAACATSGGCDERSAARNARERRRRDRTGAPEHERHRAGRHARHGPRSHGDRGGRRGGAGGDVVAAAHRHDRRAVR